MTECFYCNYFFNQNPHKYTRFYFFFIAKIFIIMISGLKLENIYEFLMFHIGFALHFAEEESCAHLRLISKGVVAAARNISLRFILILFLCVRRQIPKALFLGIGFKPRFGFLSHISAIFLVSFLLAC